MQKKIVALQNIKREDAIVCYKYSALYPSGFRGPFGFVRSRFDSIRSDKFYFILSAGDVIPFET